MNSIPELAEARKALTAGARLRGLTKAAEVLRHRLSSGPRAAAFWAFDLATFPYPTRFGLWGCAAGFARISPYLLLLHRMHAVRFADRDGTPRTLVMNPSDIDAAMAAPFFDTLIRRYGRTLSVRMLSTRFGRAEDQLRAAGLDPRTVDYITFDHLHVQDLRPLLGDRGIYPRAKLLVQRSEWQSVFDLHPVQRHWYVPNGCDGIPEDRVVQIEGDVDLGGGVALVFTPGHTVGNQTLVVHTEAGIFCVAENGVSADCYSPTRSSIGGLARHAKHYGLEVILNANTVQGSEEQYTSMLLERTIAGRSARNPDFYNVCPSSELTRWALSPGTAPTFSHGRIRVGPIAGAVP